MVNKRIKKLNIRSKLLYGGIFLGITISIGFIFFLFLDEFLFLTSLERGILLGLLFFFWGIIIFKYKPHIPHKLESLFPHFNGRLFASLTHYPKQLGYSEEFIAKIHSETEELLHKLPINRVVKLEIKKLLPFLLGGVIFLILTGVILIPKNEVGVKWKRFFLPYYKGLELSVERNKEEIKFGEEVEFKVIPKGMKPKNIKLVIGEKEFKVKREKNFKYKEIITLPVFYYAKLREIVSDTYYLHPKQLPKIEKLEIICNYPPYTGVKEFKTHSLIVDVVYGSHITLQGKTNIEIDSIKIIPHPSFFLFKLLGNCNFVAKFQVFKSDTYKIEILAKNGIKRIDDKKLYLTVWEDNYPTVKILYPGEDIPFPLNMKLPLTLHLQDDYGISNVFLVTTRDTFTICKVLKTKDTLLTYLWDLNSLSILPGEAIEYRVKVYDNDAIKGPKFKFSSKYRLYFPHLDEIYSYIEEVTSHSLEDLSSLHRQFSTFSQKLSLLQEKIKKHLSSHQKSSLLSTLNEIKQSSSQLKSLTSQISKLSNLIQDNPLVSSEVKERIKELESLYKEIPILDSLLNLAYSALKKEPHKLQERLKSLNLTQKQLLDALDRTIALLKQFKKEELLRMATEKAKQVEEWQKDISRKLDEGREFKEMSKEEKLVKKEMEELIQKLEKLKKELPEYKEEIKVEKERGEKISKYMKDIANSLEEGIRPYDEEKKTSFQLSLLSMNLNKLYQQTRMKGKKYALEKLKKLEEEVFFIINEQEDLLVSDTFPFIDRAFKQQAILQGMNKVKKEVDNLLKFTPLMKGEISSTVDKITSQMEKVKERFKNNSDVSSSNRFSLLSDLNLLLSQLLDTESSLHSSCSGTGIPSFFQALQQITDKQQLLNTLTQSLLPINISQSSAQQFLSELARQQMGLANRLREIAQSLRGRVLGDLGGLADEMEEIAKELEKEVTQSIIERQKKVLKYLRRTQKSIYTRKKIKRRIAEVGRNFYNLPKIPKVTLKVRGDILQKEIIEALKKAYPKEYKKLIRAYFKSISIY